MSVWKTLGKITGGVALAAAMTAGGGLGYLRFFKPVMRPPTSEIVERTPNRLARGTYLVEHLLACMHCHSEHDITRFDMPIIHGEGSGGFVFNRTLGLPGEIQPPNITPDVETGIGGHTDGEIMRAIREGIGKDGRALFPMMPYTDFRKMSDEDLRSVVVYLRALPAVKKRTAAIVLDFPVGYFIRSVPTPVTEVIATPDDARDHLKYGEYLVRMAECQGCHTAIDQRGQPLEGREFAGGREFATSWDNGRLGPRVVTANITSDPETGYFGRTSKQEWITRVRGYSAMKDDLPEMKPGTNTLMPWLAFSGLTEQDLGAIYDYMKTVPPIFAKVNSFPDVQ